MIIVLKYFFYLDLIKRYLLPNLISDFLKFVGPWDRAGRKSQGPAILPSMPVLVSDKKFCFAPEIGNATGMPE
jgi:hypothetical protein